MLFLTYGLVYGTGNALIFNGINNYLECGIDNRDVIDQVTVEAWIKTNSLGHHHIITKYDRDNEHGYQLLLRDGKAALAGRDGSGVYRLSGFSPFLVADNQWHHLAGVVSSGTWMIYVDGILQNQNITGYTTTDLTNTEKLLIGNYYYIHLGHHFYKGQIDEVKIWKKALTAAEIRQNMCQSTPATSPDLVAYYKLDAVTVNTVKDFSPMHLDGTLKNINAASAIVSSGAPIGDKSIYRYTNDWETSLELITDKANFSVYKVAPATKGFHLYTIKSAPSTTSGINSPQEVEEYYGLYKIGDASNKYKVALKQYGILCGSDLYRRQDNTVTTWNLVADTTDSPVILYTSNANYGEFAATSQLNLPISISGPTKICAAPVATLKVENAGNRKIHWSTGETAASIEVSESGTYWVETVASENCSSRDELTISFTAQPAIALPTEISTCYGEPVTLDATTSGASTYLWSTGQTTPNIEVAAPGNYNVTVVVINGCSFVHTIQVLEDDCIVIPNIITPNGDGKNDLFIISGANSANFELEIFNRWGNSVYKSTQYDNSWTAAAVDDGLYYYQLKSSLTNKSYKGWLEIIR